VPVLGEGLKNIPTAAVPWILLCLTDLRLRLLPHCCNRKFLDPRTRYHIHCGHMNASDMHCIDKVVRSVAIAATHPLVFNFSCLRKALVIRMLLSAKGISSHITYGVAEERHEPRFHAWVTAILPNGYHLAIDPTNLYGKYSTLHPHVGEEE